jgi:hypothetical protein
MVLRDVGPSALIELALSLGTDAGFYNPNKFTENPCNKIGRFVPRKG